MASCAKALSCDALQVLTSSVLSNRRNRTPFAVKSCNAADICWELDPGSSDNTGYDSATRRLIECHFVFS